MKLLTTLSALALLSACAVHQPDPCLNNNNADCSDRARPTIPKERECLGFHCGHTHDRTEGCGACWPWPGSETDRPRPEPEPEGPTDEPDSETDPEGYRDWKDAVERQREIDEHTRELEESGAFDEQAEDVTRSLQLWMWSMQAGDMT